MKSLLSVCTFAVVMAGMACTKVIENPSTPSSVNPGNAANPDTRRVIAFDVRCPEEGEGLQCWAWVGFSDQSAQEVSGLATWSTSDTSIATVNSTGIVTAHRAGEVAIRAAFQGVQGFATVWAEPGQGLRGTYRVLIGTVSNFNGGGLEGVLMQVIEGPNAGRSTTTFPNGGFRMENLKDGPLVIRFTKTGYVTGNAYWHIPGSKEHWFSLRPVQ